MAFTNLKNAACIIKPSDYIIITGIILGRTLINSDGTDIHVPSERGLPCCPSIIHFNKTFRIPKKHRFITYLTKLTLKNADFTGLRIS